MVAVLFSQRRVQRMKEHISAQATLCSGADRIPLLQSCIAQLRQGRSDLALPALHQIWASHPDDRVAGYFLAATLLRNGRASEALAVFDSLLRRHPHDAKAHHARGLALFALGDRSGALDAFRQAVAADPLSWRAWQSIADITPHEDDRIDAVEGAADALVVTCQLDATPPYRAAAEALLKARQPTRACRLLEDRAGGPGADLALIQLFARSFYQMGQFERAFTEATRLLTALPAPPTPRSKPAGLEPGHATAVLIEIQSILSAAGVSSFLVAGTLLGFHRSGGPLPHDRDIDIGVLRDSNGGPDIAGILRAHPEILLPSISRPGDRYFGLQHRGVAIDIFLHDRKDNHVLYGFSNLPGDIQWRLNAFTLNNASYGGRVWTVPGAPERYLSQSYGLGWETPDPHFASAISSPALHQTDPHARAYCAVVRSCRARAAGDTGKAKALLFQSPVSASQSS
ncbi:MAG: tetratricopeptide repeat protein [Hyphomonas sp.]